MASQDVTLITAIAGLVFGAVGAVLGVINTWRSVNRDRLKVMVHPVSRRNAETWEEIGFGIEVTNLSWVPISISQVGFILKKRDPNGERVRVVFPSMSGCKLPERMEPRASFTAYIPTLSHFEGWHLVEKAFADTACGLRFTGTTNALKAKIAASRRRVSQIGRLNP